MNAPIPLVVTGAELAALVEAEARRQSLPVTRYAIDLSRWPDKWLAQLRAAKRPTAATVARVRALLAGEPVPPAPANNFQSAGGGATYRPHPGSWTLTPRAPLPPRIERDPCFRCGTRGDIGCSHRKEALHA